MRPDFNLESQNNKKRLFKEIVQLESFNLT